MRDQKAEYYVYEGGNERVILQSLGLVSDYTGIKYRTVQRIFSKTDIYYDSVGNYKVFKARFVQDKRKNNSNPTMVK